ncbi:Uu.00g032780.m01.CDS01 [Anthostomella pinea]|uniref:Uu.00g032780.m01.CDS01 n=1 Tax=Anthostomella pinea TaxID=933095 RepID=A0AAI8V9R6_9PEZI|nr:Uu.00g032780.m01.CDS01 [Anthostomella pinea]
MRIFDETSTSDEALPVDEPANAGARPHSGGGASGYIFDTGLGTHLNVSTGDPGKMFTGLEKVTLRNASRAWYRKGPSTTLVTALVPDMEDPQPAYLVDCSSEEPYE